MKSIKTYARFLELFALFIGIPLQVVGFCYQWLYGSVTDYNADICNRFFATISHHPAPHISTAMLPPLSRLLSMLVDSVALGLLLFGTFYFVQVLRAFQRGEIFTNSTLLLVTKMGRFAFAWALYHIVEFTLLGLTTTLLNPPGYHILAIGFNSTDIINIFIAGSFLVIISIIYEGNRIQHEQDLTV